VLPYEEAKILAKASGFVSRVHVDIGDRVEKDQILAELWIPEMEQERLVALATVDEAAAVVKQMEAAVVAAKAKLTEEQASVARYQADVDFRRGEHDRIAQLVSRKSLNEGLLDEKLNQLRSAESALAAAQAAVASAEANIQVESANLSHAQARQRLAEANLKKTEVLMSYAEIRAPFAGLVTHRNVDTGDFVASAAGNHPEPILTLCTVDRLRIVVDIPESLSAQIQVGQRAEFVCNATGDSPFQGTVKRTAGVLDPRTRTLRIEAELDSPNESIRPGMYGSLTVTLTPELAAK
jgi:multidrug resistance efflux pump